MRLINTTSSHSELVRNQLRNTDAQLVETYSAGNMKWVVWVPLSQHQMFPLFWCLESFNSGLIKCLVNQI